MGSDNGVNRRLNAGKEYPYRKLQRRKCVQPIGHALDSHDKAGTGQRNCQYVKESMTLADFSPYRSRKILEKPLRENTSPAMNTMFGRSPASLAMYGVKIGCKISMTI